jgi:hypothetical protein
VTHAVLTPIIAKAADADLEDWGPLDEATGEEMATHGVELWVDDMAVFPKGWTGTWELHETVRKVYSIF